MRRRSFFVGVPVIYAVTVYLALAGGQSRGEGAEVLVLVIALSVAGGLGAWRFAAGLEAARAQAERGREDLALVGRLSAGLSGPRSPGEVATAFLDGIKGLLPVSVVATLLQYEETAETIRILAQYGAGALPRDDITYPVGALPPGMRAKLIGEHRSYVLDETATEPEWPPFVSAIPALAGAQSFAALPLVSGSRLIGALVPVMRDLTAQIALAAPVKR